MILGTIWNFLSPRCGLRGIPTSVLEENQTHGSSQASLLPKHHNGSPRLSRLIPLCLEDKAHFPPPLLGIESPRSSSTNTADMTNRITCVFEMDILPGKVDGFRDLIKQAVEATSKELGVLVYEYAISEDGQKAYIVERYLGEALVPHVDVTFSPFATPFLEHVKFARLMVFGKATAEMRQRLDPFGAVYVNTYCGFDRLGT